MTDESDALREALCRAFPDHDPAPLMAELMSYGEQPWHNEAHRVRLAIVQLAAGDAAQLPFHLAVAKEDYRDVLAAVSRPPPSPAQLAADLAAVRDLLDRWGKK
jgi:hypothetical protein